MQGFVFLMAFLAGTIYTITHIYIFLRIKKNKKQNLNFLGIAISVKLAKAVKRNHIKRLIRENYQFYENAIKSGYHIVFLWKKKASIENSTFQNIQKDMKTIFDKAKMIEEKP